MKKSARLASIGAAAAVGVSILLVNPFAQAQTGESPDQIMKNCLDSRSIGGVTQELGVGQSYGFDTCDFVQESFTVIEGTEVKASVDFANCPPDLFENGEAEVKYSHTVEQVTGTAKISEVEYEAVAGPINKVWTSHNNTVSLDQRSVEAANTETFAIAEGQVLSVYYKPKIAVMKGHWRVWRAVRGGNGVQPGSPEYTATVAETVTGPAMLPSGSMDGTSRPQYDPC